MSLSFDGAHKTNCVLSPGGGAVRKEGADALKFESHQSPMLALESFCRLPAGIALAGLSFRSESRCIDAERIGESDFRFSAALSPSARCAASIRSQATRCMHSVPINSTHTFGQTRRQSPCSECRGTLWGDKDFLRILSRGDGWQGVLSRMPNGLVARCSPPCSSDPGFLHLTVPGCPSGAVIVGCIVLASSAFACPVRRLGAHAAASLSADAHRGLAAVAGLCQSRVSGYRGLAESSKTNSVDHSQLRQVKRVLPQLGRCSSGTS